MMETVVRTPMGIFFLPQRLVIPLFQRQYVWTETEQWLPLWQDVRRMSELRLTDPTSTATHFLGAVVMQVQITPPGSPPTRNIIDGQQRLTTLQLLLDASRSVMEQAEADDLAEQLKFLTHNITGIDKGEDRLKLVHNNRDRSAYVEVMHAEPPVDHSSLRHSGSLLVGAHRFFVDAVSEWLGDSESADFRQRAESLVSVLSQGLQLVVIDLQPHENSQEIFETLNARGTPLTASDLIKNFVFQRLESEGADVRRAFAEDWPFESKFWDTELGVGRYTVTRSSLFLNQWLGSRVGEEISPKSTFTRFKHFVEHEAGQKVSDLLVVIRQQAELYEAWIRAAADPDRSLSPTDLAVYRMQAGGVELLKPILIWLHEPGLNIPVEVANQVIAATESWMMRRQLLRLPSADLGRVVADIVRLHRGVEPKELGQRVRDYLAGLSAASTYWPGDDEIRAALATEVAYRRYPRTRLRMLLEAVEDRLRSAYDQPPVPRRGYPIEHVLPQKWEANWGVDGLEAQLDRAAHVHRLGNLTLITRALNASVSNAAWQGPNGKRAKLARHDVFLMNRIFREESTEVWNEKTIDERTESMIEALLATWPVPPGHSGAAVDAKSTDTTWIELKHLVAAGLLAPGTRLVPRPGKWTGTQAVVTADGRLDVDGKIFDSPSGAGRFVKGSSTNGWYFWRLGDGRRLVDVRALYRGRKPGAEADWSLAHQILEVLPEGRWTTYEDIADAIGVAAQALQDHSATCHQCTNLHRVLASDGRVSNVDIPANLTEEPDLRELLHAEGVPFVDGRPDDSRRLTSEDLAGLGSTS